MRPAPSTTPDLVRATPSPSPPSPARSRGSRRAGSRRVIEVGNLDARRDFLDVRDVVRAYRAVLNYPASAGTYNICRGHAFPLREVLFELLALSSLHRCDPRSTAYACR